MTESRNDIIGQLGGPAMVARLLGFPGRDRGAKRVRAWRRRGSIPRKYWKETLRLAEAAGYRATLDDLAPQALDDR